MGGCQYFLISRDVLGMNYKFIPDIHPGVPGHVILIMSLPQIYVWISLMCFSRVLSKFNYDFTPGTPDMSRVKVCSCKSRQISEVYFNKKYYKKV